MAAPPERDWRGVVKVGPIRFRATRAWQLGGRWGRMRNVGIWCRQLMISSTWERISCPGRTGRLDRRGRGCHRLARTWMICVWCWYIAGHTEAQSAVSGKCVAFSVRHVQLWEIKVLRRVRAWRRFGYCFYDRKELQICLLKMNNEEWRRKDAGLVWVWRYVIESSMFEDMWSNPVYIVKKRGNQPLQTRVHCNGKPHIRWKPYIRWREYCVSNVAPYFPAPPDSTCNAMLHICWTHPVAPPGRESAEKRVQGVILLWLIFGLIQNLWSPKKACLVSCFASIFLAGICPVGGSVLPWNRKHRQSRS